MKRALISVTDKTGVVKFAKELSEMGYEIISTGGTLKEIANSGVCVTPVDSVTDFPEILDGRVKTLHPLIHGGILYKRDNPEHIETVSRHGIHPIDIVVVNLYDFEGSLKLNRSHEAMIENIDIGGPSMIRSAAKNYRDVLVVVRPADYDNVAELLKKDKITLEFREELAMKAFTATAYYDSMISRYFMSKTGKESDSVTFGFKKVDELRYGENPHQEAALYLPPMKKLPWVQLGGKPLSYNNILDLDCAMRGAALLQDGPGALVIKHTTPCGMAYGSTLKEAYEKAFRCDPLSAFGGVVGFSRPLDMETALAVSQHFTEVLLVPDGEDEALEFLKKDKPSLRILKWKGGKVLPWQITSTWSGFLVQQDILPPLPNPDKGTWIGPRRDDLWKDMLLAWKVACLSKSNAVAIIKDGEAVGIGMGFCSRVFAVDFATNQAKEKAKGAVMGSDAFFPFPDGVEAAAKAGIKAIIQPGGSVRDDEVFKRAEELGLSMFISGWRTFRH